MKENFDLSFTLLNYKDFLSCKLWRNIIVGINSLILKHLTDQQTSLQICTCFDSANRQPHSRLVSQTLNTCSLKNAYVTIIRVMTLAKLRLLVQVKQIADINSDKQKTFTRVFQFLTLFQQRPTILL